MELVIITGMSGAGKSIAVNALEDLGFYCVDNIPPMLIGRFLELCAGSSAGMERVGIVIDIRSRDMFSDLSGCLDEVRSAGHQYKIIFLDCGDDAINRRYKETRRRHPLMDGECATVEEALAQERRFLAPAKALADFVIDTTLLKPGQLKERVFSLFAGERQAMVVNVMSFGFKHGIPPESDLVFDLRSLPNPFYIGELRPLTGLDAPVYDYVFGFEEAGTLYDKIVDLARLLAGMAAGEGRSQFTLSLGCTGGHHRSVAFVRRMGEMLAADGFNARTAHRDIAK